MLFTAGGIATPADAAMMMQLGAEGVFVGSGIFKSGDPAKRAAAIVKATTFYDDPDVVAKVSRGLGEAMVGINLDTLPPISTTPAAAGNPVGPIARPPDRRCGPPARRPGPAAFPAAAPRGWPEERHRFRRSTEVMFGGTMPASAAPVIGSRPAGRRARAPARPGGRGARAIPVRRPEELGRLDGLVIPGGESTTMCQLSVAFDLLEPLRELISAGLPVYGSCAGMILLADRIVDGTAGQETLGGLDMTVRRNAFGRQVDSFESDLDVRRASTPVRARGLHPRALGGAGRRRRRGARGTEAAGPPVGSSRSGRGRCWPPRSTRS